jgi:hypothetical protein
MGANQHVGRGLFLHANPRRQHNPGVAKEFVERLGLRFLRAVRCDRVSTQQKYLIHFIRDLNNAILEHPYDEGLKQLAGNFAGVVKPIVETVDRRGLKKRFP